MKNYSIWKQEQFKDMKKVNQNIDTDVLIIGGGITGLSTLYHLSNEKIKTILVERNRCGEGVSLRSTAKITYLQEKIFMNIRKLVGIEEAKKYLKSQIEAVNILKDIIIKEKIDCDLKRVDSYLFTNEKKNIGKLEEEYSFLKEMGVEVKKVKQIPDLEVKLALKVSDTYVFHPLKYISYLKNRFEDIIYEDSKIENIRKFEEGYECSCNGYIIRAKYVVMATHYPYFLFPFMMIMKSHVETSYIGAREVRQFKNISAINIDKPCISIRYHSDKDKNYCIYLYQSFMACNIKNIKDNFDLLNKKYKFDYVWSNKDIITSDFMPYIGRVYKNNDTFLLAGGYNTWGMTNGTLAGKIIADIIRGRKNEYEELFSLHRRMNLGRFIHFPIDLGCSAKALIKGLKTRENNSKVSYKKIDGKNVAIYKDIKGEEHIVLNKCPHMKCGIVFNEVEQTWDCYCHGSRFDLDGKCIEGPSNYDICYKDDC